MFPIRVFLLSFPQIWTKGFCTTIFETSSLHFLGFALREGKSFSHLNRPSRAWGWRVGVHKGSLPRFLFQKNEKVIGKEISLHTSFPLYSQNLLETLSFVVLSSLAPLVPVPSVPGVRAFRVLRVCLLRVLCACVCGVRVCVWCGVWCGVVCGCVVVCVSLFVCVGVCV